MRTFAALALGFLCGPAWGQTSYPMITHTSPVAVQRGKTAEVTVEGQMNFAGAYKVLFDGTGVAAEVLAPAASKGSASRKSPTRSVKLKVTADADAPLGVRDFRIAS